MKWYWKVRIYKPGGESYRHAQIQTARNLDEIGFYQDFYLQLTGSKMLLEGMSESGYNLDPPGYVFAQLLKDAK